MGWVTPPTFEVGEDMTAALMNELSGDLAVLATGDAMYAVGSAISGSAPATTAPNFYTQGGHASGVSLSSGIATITFPTAFPNGLLTVIVNTSAASATSPDADIVVGIYGGGTNNASQFEFYGWNTNTNAAAGSVSINWIAIGF